MIWPPYVDSPQDDCDRAPCRREPEKLWQQNHCGIFRSVDGGENWTQCSNKMSLPQTDCYDFAFRHALDLANGQLAFGTACGSLYTSGDRGETWQTISNHLPPIYSVRFARLLTPDT